MDIRFRGAILLVRDMAHSKAFYHGLLGLKLLRDGDSFALLEGGLSLHDANVFYGYLQKPYGKQAMGRDNLDLYFTSGQLDRVQERLKQADVVFIHEIKPCPWGERVLRVRDPDGHIVEIGDAR